MKIFLIGLPGSGKTTLGKKIAETQKWRFVDLDSEVEKLEGKTIQKIFTDQKEAYFRKLESKVLKIFCDSVDDFVMATGGGAPCFFNNMELMNKSGKTIFLDVSTSEIARRLSDTNLSERPLFAKLSTEQLKDKIEWLRSQRIPFYRIAHLVFSDDNVPPEEIISKIRG